MLLAFSNTLKEILPERSCPSIVSVLKQKNVHREDTGKESCSAFTKTHYRSVSRTTVTSSYIAAGHKHLRKKPKVRI